MSATPCDLILCSIAAAWRKLVVMRPMLQPVIRNVVLAKTLYGPLSGTLQDAANAVCCR
jgi:hypothetical protein